MTMKLLIATPLYPPEVGGPATYVKELEEGLPAHGIEPIIVKFKDVRQLPVFFRHHAYYKKLLAYAQDADALLALDPVSVGLPASEVARKLKKPFFVKIVGDYAWEQGRQRFGVTKSLDEFIHSKNIPFVATLFRHVQTMVAVRAKRIIVPSPYLKDIVAAWGVGDEKIEVISNAISIPTPLPEFSKEAGMFLIVSTGRRVPWKGFEAIERIGKKHGHDGWKVRIISGVQRSEALSWVKAADVFVLNSSYEGFPHALVEAMTLGTPVVASDNRGNAFLVTHGENGLLVPQGDEDALEGALMEVWKNREAALVRAHRAKERMQAFTVPAMLKATAQFLKEHV